MPKRSLSHLECSVANTVEIVSDPWTILVLRDAFQGVKRFDQFVDSLGIARNTLTSRLEHLVATGLMRTEPYQDNPVRYEYRLTDRGKDLFDVLMTLWTYGERWNPAQSPDRQVPIHVLCGEKVESVAHCAHCGERLSLREVRIEPPNRVLTTVPAV